MSGVKGKGAAVGEKGGRIMKATVVAKEWPLALGLAAVAVLIFQYGADSWWLPADDGAYAHITQRVFDGQLPHRDFKHPHPGAVLWLNLWAFKLGGVSLAVLRWPAIWANLVQAVVVYILLRRYGRDAAFLGVVWTGAVGLPAIPSPSASVVCTMVCLAAVLVASGNAPWRDRRTLLLLGLLLGTAFLCRQLGAGYLGCGLLSWVLATEATQDKVGRGSVFGRFLLLFSAVAMLAPSWGRSDALGTLLFGVGPFLLAGQALWIGRPSAEVTYRLVSWVGLGYFLAFVPMVAYYAWAGILGLWWREAFAASLSSYNVGFASAYRYSDLFSEVLSATPYIRNPLQVVQLFAWLFLLFATPFTTGYCLLRRARGKEVPTFVFCAPFFALGALIVEIEVYLLWAIPAVLVAVVAIAAEQRPPIRKLCFGALALLLVGFFNSAIGKPVWLSPRTSFVLTPWGQRQPLVHLAGRADLYLSIPVAAFYQRSLDLIEKEVGEDESIFSFPYHAEWYFLSRRRNPTGDTMPSGSMVNQKDLAQMEATIRQARPRMLIFGRSDPFNTPLTLQLRQNLGNAYHLVREDSGYEFLLRND